MYDASLLDPGGLPRLVPVANMPSMAQAERWLERVWLDHKPGWTARFIHPAENMPEYGREIATQIGDVSLLLLVDVPNKETLLIRFVQLGIDLYGIVDNGGSWPADGGHGSGRKWPILFAGLMLNNSAMLNIGSTTVRFGEDQQTFYVSQNDVNVTNGPTWNPDERRGPAEPYTTGDIGMPEWGIRHAQSNTWDNKAWNAIYRECCTANAWVGFVLSARILGMQSAWNHDALFDYQDRYMDVSQSWRAWSQFSASMWDTYRSDY